MCCTHENTIIVVIKISVASSLYTRDVQGTFVRWWLAVFWKPMLPYLSFLFHSISSLELVTLLQVMIDGYKLKTWKYNKMSVFYIYCINNTHMSSFYFTETRDWKFRYSHHSTTFRILFYCIIIVTYCLFILLFIVFGVLFFKLE